MSLRVSLRGMLRLIRIDAGSTLVFLVIRPIYLNASSDKDIRQIAKNSLHYCDLKCNRKEFTPLQLEMLPIRIGNDTLYRWTRLI